MLKDPVKLSSSVRDMDGIPIALGNTIDGGSAVVVWKNSSWVLSEGFNVGDVMKSPEMGISKNFPKLLNEYIYYGMPENQLPSEMQANEHQLKLLKQLSPEELKKIIEKYGNIFGLTLENEKVNEVSIKRKENVFLKYIKKYEVKYTITATIILFFILFYIFPLIF